MKLTAAAGLCIILLFLLFSGAAWAQENVDSLRKKVDTGIVQMLQQHDAEAEHRDILQLMSDGVESYPALIIETGNKLIKAGRKKNDLVLESSGWSLLGQGYRLTGDFSRAIDCHFKAIALAKQTGYHSVLAYAYNQCGHIFKDRLENDKALSYYRIAAKEGMLGNGTDDKWFPFMNIAVVYLNTGNLDSSVWYSNKALSVYQQSGIPSRFEANIRTTLGAALSRKGEKADAEIQFAIVPHIPSFTDLRYRQLYYVALAQHFQRYNEPDSFYVYAKKAIVTIENSGYAYLMAKPAKMLADAYEKQNADSAIKYLKLYISTNDILNSTRVTQQLQARSFEEEEKQRELDRAQKNYRTKLQLYTLVAGLLVLSLFLFYYYRNNKNTAAKNVLLAAQKQEIENTLLQLKQTQTQLVHAEKMASLGELTAGIAHEIQNPLNFVNNFSDLNRELIAELREELKAGNHEDVEAIANDIESNEEKINHHGQRAQSIVSGMLQHSRSGKGEKQLTDINKLSDEYLRLAYHGLRSKDKNFNCDIETSFDETIGEINIIPQEIGRVVLNLVNNAFYAVNEKTKKGVADYRPLVNVATKKENNCVSIAVKDNGNGIPEKIKEKIFQPFFTTKPTGQGTGLGLSLTYDIVKAHGGEISVESTQGEGTKFIINFPK